MSNNTISPKQSLINDVRVLLADNLLDIDLTVNDYETALKIALERYKQRAGNATQEAIFFLTLQPDQQVYQFPTNVIEVTKLLRRGLSANSGETIGNQYDPFSLAYTQLYLLQPTGQGDLLTYEYYNQWLSTAGKMFGATYDFRWNSREHNLFIIRQQQITEDILVTVYMDVDDDSLINDRYAKPWLRSYTLAMSKMILGQAYETFSSIPSPNGGVVLNGAQLKAEAQTAMTELEDQLRNYQDGSRPLPLLIG